MEHGITCRLVIQDDEVHLELYDAKCHSKECHEQGLFTVLPEEITKAINNRELMADLGENILIRLAVSNGIKL